jgi:hypothetical protein
MKKLILILALTALPAMANPALFSRYEAVRQGLLKESLADVQKSATALATDASSTKQAALAAKASAVAKAADLKAARTAFGALSDEMIKVREAATGARPAVYYCPMVKQSWLQAKGDIGNPYDKAMQTCGMLKAE